MQAFIKEDKIVINTQILNNEKPKLQKFIEKAETPFVSATTLYDIEGNPAGLAFENIEGSVLDTTVDTEIAASSNDIRLGKVAFSNGERVEGTSIVKIPNCISFYSATFEELPDELANADWSEYSATPNVTNQYIGLFSNCSRLKVAKKLNKFSPVNLNNYCYSCGQLTKVECIDTSRCTSMLYAFHRCYNLVDLPVLDMSNMFSYGCEEMIGSCGKLSDQSLRNILTSLLSVGQKYGFTHYTLSYIRI